jgi:Kdo2-lipid IVA lauroyltransferase/acyltransferase
MIRGFSVPDKIKLILLWFYTLLPHRVLHILSDLLYVIIFFLVKYRRKIVIETFPEKKPEGNKLITQKYYSYLCEYFMESIYGFFMSHSGCKCRYQLANFGLLKDNPTE